MDGWTGDGWMHVWTAGWLEARTEAVREDFLDDGFLKDSIQSQAKTVRIVQTKGRAATRWSQKGF